MTLALRTSAGGEVALEESQARAFAASLRGELIRPGDAMYDTTRRVWNGMVDHRPALIARCRRRVVTLSSHEHSAKPTRTTSTPEWTPASPAPPPRTRCSVPRHRALWRYL